MGGALKALLPLAGRPLLSHVLARLSPAVENIAVSANDPAVAAAADGRPLLADAHEDRRGPLAGILAGMAWARSLGGCRFLVSLPVDCPFAPRDLVARLCAEQAASGARVVIATSGGHAHPTSALWDLSLWDELALVVAAGTDLSVRRFYEMLPHAFCEFRAGAIDPFFNINTLENLARAADAVAMGENLEAVVTRDADQGHADGLGRADGEQRRR
jgi:molybdopterin-guanine dinucleotide biosynthesis protein A